MKVNANDVVVWIGVGEKLFRVGAGVYDSVMSALRSAGVEADQRQLDEIHADYQARIARAKAAADGQ